MAKVSISVLISLVYDAQAAWLEPTLAERGLTWSQFQLLGTIHGGRGEVSQNDVCRHLGLSPATVSEALDLLAQRGLVMREASGKDKRTKMLVLTPQGRTVAEALRQRALLGESSMLQGVLEADLRVTARVLEQMVKNLG